MENSYWTRVLDQRLTRRKAIALVASSGMAAALIACGGGSGGGGSGSGSQAKAGAYTPGEGSPVKGGRFVQRGATSRNYNVVTRGAGGVHIYDYPLTSREGERRYRLEAMESV